MQSTLKRLIEAEGEAREILKAAEEHAQSVVAEAREQADQSVDAVRQEEAKSLRSRLEAAELLYSSAPGLVERAA